MSADLPIELIELLEKIILEPSPFSENKNLQNLLMLTAVRADKGKVVGYIDKLQNYDSGDIARIATEHGLYEEAFLIYKKYEQHEMAINVLVEHIVSLDRGVEYATKVNKPEVWSRLAKAQLDGLRIKDAIGQSFLLFTLCGLLDSLLQTRTSRRKILLTSLRSLRSPTAQANTTISFATYRWLGSIYGSPRSTRSWHMHTPRRIDFTTWKTSSA